MGWQSVTLPHDWAIALPYCEEAEQRHGHRLSTPIELIGQTPGEPLMRKVPTIGWYRRNFDVPAEWLGKRILVEFDGVYRDSRVWINGQYIDRHGSGYTGFRYDLTDNLYYGEENSLAVAADARELEGWWYEGAGIYRHVRLLVAEPLYIDPLDIRVEADMNGRYLIEGMMTNESDADAAAEIMYRLTAPDGTIAAEGSAGAEAGAWSKGAFRFEGAVDRPALWSPDEPNLLQNLPV